jgi:hypothetical protein
MAREPSSAQQEFSRFWLTFRSATLQRDWQKLEYLTSFPLTIRGELDRDPVRRVRRREFQKVFDGFLKEGVFSRNEQMEFIRKTITIQSGEDSLAARRVGDMIFRKTVKGWRLDTLYMQYNSD